MKENVNFFHFFVALIEIWLQNQIKHIVSGIIPTFFVWIRHIWENKNITSSGCSHSFSVNFRFLGHFWLSEVIETPTKPQFQPLSMPSKRVWANILSGAGVIERPDWILEKKLVSSFFRQLKSHRSLIFFKVKYTELKQTAVPLILEWFSENLDFVFSDPGLLPILIVAMANNEEQFIMKGEENILLTLQTAIAKKVR